MPSSFDWTFLFAPRSRSGFFVPFPISNMSDRMRNTPAIISQLKPRVAIKTAQAELIVKHLL